MDGQIPTFGREPVYVRAAELPPQLADDPKLRIEKREAWIGERRGPILLGRRGRTLLLPASVDEDAEVP